MAVPDIGFMNNMAEVNRRSKQLAIRNPELFGRVLRKFVFPLFVMHCHGAGWCPRAS
jgi:hypothetical protein